MAVAGTALAADATAPVVCGANGCAHLPTATLQGLLTLPGALRPSEPPPAQPFVLFRVEGPDGVFHQVVYVTRDGGALLGFEGAARWRLVPVDDAKLLADAARGRTPYAAPAADAPLGALFAARESSGGTSAAWLALATALALGVAGVTVSVTVLARRRADAARRAR